MIQGNRLSNLVLLRGGGDIASGVAYRLFMSGFGVVILEIPKPTHIRRTVSFAQAVYDGEILIEDVRARHIDNTAGITEVLEAGELPVLIDPAGEAAYELKPDVVVDSILAKKNLGTDIHMAPIVIGVGPGFEAGVDVHAVVETNRGHFLGRVILKGRAQPDTGVPGTIQGFSADRVIRANTSGEIIQKKNIGDLIEAGDVVAAIGESDVKAKISGVLRGMINPGIKVRDGFKIGDIDPRGDPVYCRYISDKSRAVGGGVLEAVLRHQHRGPVIHNTP